MTDQSGSGGVVRLQAGGARAEIDPAHGGRLASLTVAGRERLRGPRRTDGSAWDRPIDWGLFLMAPWVGRLDQGRLPTTDGDRQLPRDHGAHAIHGTVHDSRWTVVAQDAALVELDTPLAAPWPLGGHAAQTVQLGSDGLDLHARVQAGDVGMPAALGWHPWFVVEDAEVTGVHLEAAGVLERREDLVPTGGVTALDERTRLDGRPLGDRRLDDTYVGTGDGAVVVLPDLTLRLQWSSAVTAVTVHSPAGALCVEPLTAWPNAPRLEAAGVADTGLRHLAAGEHLEATVSIHWS